MTRHMHGRMHPTDLISRRKAFPARRMLGSVRPTELISRPMTLATRICSLSARIWRLLEGIFDGRARTTKHRARNLLRRIDLTNGRTHPTKHVTGMRKPNPRQRRHKTRRSRARSRPRRQKQRILVWDTRQKRLRSRQQP